MDKSKYFLIIICGFLLGIISAHYFLEKEFLKIFLSLVAGFYCLRKLATRLGGGLAEFFDYSNFYFSLFLAFICGFLRFYFSDGQGFTAISDSAFFRFAQGIRGYFEGIVGRIFVGDAGGLVSGILLGGQDSISPALQEDFNTVGLTHIVAVSGYNISLIIAIANSMFAFLPRRSRVAAVIFSIFCFVCVVGFTASVVRAAIMGGVASLAVFFGRKYFALMALFLSAFVMNLFDPSFIIDDVGFQMSLLATMGIILFSEILEKYFRFIPKKFCLRESLVMTFAAQILVLPIILVDFERLSVISPVGNFLVLPFIPWIMLLGFIAICLYPLFAFGGLIFGFVSNILLQIVIFLVHGMASLPFAALDISWFDWYFSLGYYLVVFWFLLKNWKREEVAGGDFHEGELADGRSADNGH
ncbi:MAG: ComEC/Rec2 family competence protein [Patescibacteria group bacterium]